MNTNALVHQIVDPTNTIGLVVYRHTHAIFSWGTFWQIILVLLIVAIIAFALVLRDLVKEMSASMVAKVIEQFPILWRSALYFGGSFIMSLGDKIGGILMNDQWPSMPRVVGASIIGLGTGLIALRAYNDGSAQRLGDAIAAKKKNGFDTSMITKSPTNPPVVQAAPAQP